MNLRFPVVAAVVTVAVAAAAVRAVHPTAPSSVATVAISSDAPVPSAVPSREPRRGSIARAWVYVAGDVARPGVYAVAPSARVDDALRAAGGASRDADLVAVNLAAPVTDGEEIVVAVKGAAPRTDVESSGGSDTLADSRPHKRHRKHRARRHHRRASDASGDTSSPEPDSSPGSTDAAPTAVVDINAADENELETLPGIGPALAARIVEFRQINGPFASTDELLDVGGMTQGRLDEIEPYVSLR